MNKEKKDNILPVLRFPDFKNEWTIENLGSLADNLSNRRIPITSNKREKGDIPYYGASGVIDYVKDFIFDEELLLISEDGANLLDRNYPIAYSISGKTWVNNHAHVLKFENKSTEILVQKYINSKSIEEYLTGKAQPKLNRKNLERIRIPLAKDPKEQQKIANCLSSLDNLITAETEKLELLKDHKKGLLQQLFPAKGETKPLYRFPEFKNDGDWIETTLGNCLDYLQPTPYLVSSTDYDDKFETPVLTAGKTFILGYTNEQEGIFNKNLPIIIFDDFTTATKFVDFPFKAKSSAMKILLSKGDNNIKFLFETIQNLKFEVSTHKRHWISVYSKLDILKPKDPKEQQKIADCFSSADDLIKAQKIKIKNLKNHKKGLMQQLFPNVNCL
ncbi:restriction endonuclease subunit S [Aurantibacter aestuarii]|uniref:Restriction endonuclease subunit S n=1 Tax=Aurantibacter aestuarii TaxID=1266046 RepID=A0A2T1N718_9FLAO|nr:restriction endonuclease subunit S [Aurantibacter aestuarii]PSG87382.1 restriction endonuclease subunit S [Aurantibacter aestuarii]